MSKTVSTLSQQLLWIMAGSCLAGAGTLAPELQSLPSSKAVEVIVRFNHGSSDHVILGRKLADLPEGGLYSMTPAQAVIVAAQPGTATVSTNRAVFPTGTVTPVYDFMPQTVQPQSPIAGFPNFVQGSGIGVVVIDSGIHVNSDLQLFGSTVVFSQNFSADPGNDADDLFGHGTHVAGLIAGNGFNSWSTGHVIHGVAPGVKLINFKVLDKNGMSTDARVISAIGAAVALKKSRPDLNIKVINLSLGRPMFEVSQLDPLCHAVEDAWLHGITVVVAAGNDGRLNVVPGTHGYGTIASPADSPLVITVGSMNTQSTAARGDDIMTSYSSKGPTLVEHVVIPA